MHKMLLVKKSVDDLNNALSYLRIRYKIAKSVGTKEEIQFYEKQGQQLRSELEQLEVRASIRQLQLQDENKLVESITLLILDMHDAFNVGKGLDAAKIQHLAYTIIERLGGLSLDDVALCFHKAKCGDYGQVFDRLDLNVVNGWLNAYVRARKEIHQQQAQNHYLANRQGAGYAIGDSSSINRVLKERGIDPGGDARYQEYKHQEYKQEVQDIQAKTKALAKQKKKKK